MTDTPHPFVLALFSSRTAAASAASALHDQGVPREDLSVVARSHDEEVDAARAFDATPGVELEDSSIASRLGELSGRVLAAMAMVMPGVGPVVAGGPLAAELGEAAGHVAGSLAERLDHVGVPRADAEVVESAVEQGQWLLAVHVRDGSPERVRATLADAGASAIYLGRWNG